MGHLDSHIEQLRTIRGTVLTFREIRELLEKQSLVETEYYTGLRDYTVGLIGYSDVHDKIDAVTSDSDSVKMCRFLEEMEDDSVPDLTAIKTTVSELADELAVLKSTKINSLTDVRDFNAKRLQLIKRITALRQDLQKLDKTNIENTCKQAVAGAEMDVGKLIGKLLDKEYTMAADYLIRASKNMFGYVRRWLKTGIVTPRVSSMIERMMREIARRLKRMAFGWSEDGAAKMARIIIKRFSSAGQWEKYWCDRLRIQDNVMLVLRSIKVENPQPLGQ